MEQDKFGLVSFHLLLVEKILSFPSMFGTYFYRLISQGGMWSYLHIPVEYTRQDLSNHQLRAIPLA